MMTKKIFFFSMLFVAQLCFAQSVTYNHDGDVMRQYTVAEEGIGSLSPDFYYDWFHKDYSSWAKKENKLAARWWMYNSIHQELGYAEQIDSSLTRRAKIEALNIADRTGGILDAAWLSEKDKITKKQEAFKKNIGLILTRGGSYADKRYWEEIYNCLSQSVNAIRDAYLPNMKRMAAYQLIYKDLVQRNNELVMMLCKWQGLKATQDMAEGSPVVKANTKNAVKSAFARWKKSMVTGSNGSVHGIGE